MTAQNHIFQTSAINVTKTLLQVIENKSGFKGAVADTLSRRGCETHLQILAQLLIPSQTPLATEAVRPIPECRK